MTEQPRKQEQKQSTEAVQQPDKSELYGMQGNEGQYGQGQYDSEGKPDPNGPQAQQIKPAASLPTDPQAKPEGAVKDPDPKKEDGFNSGKS